MRIVAPTPAVDAADRAALDRQRIEWQRAVGYVPQGASWCICDDGSCRVCEARLKEAAPPEVTRV